MIASSMRVKIGMVTALFAVALAAGMALVAHGAPQQHKTTTLTVGVGAQVLMVQQGANIILKIRLPQGVTAQLWADNVCNTPKNNAMLFTASGTYTIPVQNIKGHGELYACLLSSDGLERATLALRDATHPTATMLTSSVNPSKFGQSVTFTAAVSISDGTTGTPTGTVTFKDGTTTLGTSSLNGSAIAVFNTSALAVGSRSITAAYSGDANFTTNTSVALTQTVNQSATATALASSLNPSVSGQSVTFTATVTATGGGSGIATGTVIFKDGATTLGSGTLNGSGVATFATSTLGVASHSITATYNGDTNFATSTSITLTQTVNKSATATALASSLNPSVSGQSVTFTATVTATGGGSGTATGTITFKDGATTLGSGTLNGSGVANFATSTLSVASHSITATYSGATNFATSTSTTLTQTVKAH